MNRRIDIDSFDDNSEELYQEEEEFNNLDGILPEYTGKLYSSDRGRESRGFVEELEARVDNILSKDEAEELFAELLLSDDMTFEEDYG